MTDSRRDRLGRVPTNLRVMRPSRRQPRPGDIFVYSFGEGLYRYGRVIRDDAVVGSQMRNLLLLYFFRALSRVRDDIPPLIPTELLTAPLFSNRQPWLRGYFQTIRSVPLGPLDVLPVHCFYNVDANRVGRDECYDEYHRPLSRRSEPSGPLELGSYFTIDDLLSHAAGIAPITIEFKRRILYDESNERDSGRTGP